jgi:DNA-binding IclR family transcriptional regulator
MTTSRKWQPGALRAEIIRAVGQFTSAGRGGLPVSKLAGYTGWSDPSVRRELDSMLQLRLVRFTRPSSRAASWHLTTGGQILWLLRGGEQSSAALARSLHVTRETAHAEVIRLAHLGLIRGRADGESRTWRLAGKASDETTARVNRRG